MAGVQHDLPELRQSRRAEPRQLLGDQMGFVAVGEQLPHAGSHVGLRLRDAIIQAGEAHLQIVAHPNLVTVQAPVIVQPPGIEKMFRLGRSPAIRTPELKASSSEN